jgi:hypothetical protein
VEALFIIFTDEEPAPPLLFLVAAGPRRDCPEWLESLRAKGAGAYAACAMAALPCVLPLAFLRREPPRSLLAHSAERLGGELSVTELSFRNGLLFADAQPLDRWRAATELFAELSIPSQYTAAPGFCLGPRDRDAALPKFGPFRLRGLVLELYRLEARGEGWRDGLGWSVSASISLKRANKSGF